MRILVLGGTGAIGKHLVSALSHSDADVYVTSRSERESFGNIHYIKGNAKDIKFLSDTLREGWDAVVDFMNYTVDDFAEKVQLLLQHTKCYYFLSSSRVYADSKDKEITEDSSLLLNTATDPNYLKSNEYGLAKAKEENILRTSGKTNWTIFRPYIIYSESRFQLGALEKEDWLYRVLQGKNIVIQKSLLDKTTTLTYSPNAAEVMASIIKKNASQGEVFNIVGSKQCRATWGEVLHIYKDVIERLLNRTIRITYLSDEQSHLLRKSLTYYQTSYDRMFYRAFDNSKIAQYKVPSSYTSIYQGIEQSLEKFVKNPRFTFTNQAQEALLDRFTGEYSNPLKISSFNQKLIYLYCRFIKTY